MAPRLRFPDARAAADAMTFAGRAATTFDPAVRLVAAGGVLSLTTAALVPRDLADPTPTVLAVRALPVDADLDMDVVVDPAALTLDTDDPSAVVLPPTALRVAWAGISPPRTGWRETDRVAASAVATRAQSGIAEVAESLPDEPGEDVARLVRSRVWGAPAPDLDGLPAGAAFAALALGFIVGAEDVRVLASGAWRRLAFVRGDVLVRGPIAAGMTPVRSTGRS